MSNWVGIGIGIWFPIVICVVTAIVLAFYAGRKKPDA